jgi:hypothetical protein
MMFDTIPIALALVGGALIGVVAWREHRVHMMRRAWDAVRFLRSLMPDASRSKSLLADQTARAAKWRPSFHRGD